MSLPFNPFNHFKKNPQNPNNPSTASASSQSNFLGVNFLDGLNNLLNTFSVANIGLNNQNNSSESIIPNNLNNKKNEIIANNEKLDFTGLWEIFKKDYKKKNDAMLKLVDHYLMKLLDYLNDLIKNHFLTSIEEIDNLNKDYSIFDINNYNQIENLLNKIESIIEFRLKLIEKKIKNDAEGEEKKKKIRDDISKKFTKRIDNINKELHSNEVDNINKQLYSNEIEEIKERINKEIDYISNLFKEKENNENSQELELFIKDLLKDKKLSEDEIKNKISQISQLNKIDNHIKNIFFLKNKLDLLGVKNQINADKLNDFNKIKERFNQINQRLLKNPEYYTNNTKSIYDEKIFYKKLILNKFFRIFIESIYKFNDQTCNELKTILLDFVNSNENLKIFINNQDIVYKKLLKMRNLYYFNKINFIRISNSPNNIKSNNENQNLLKIEIEIMNNSKEINEDIEGIFNFLYNLDIRIVEDKFNMDILNKLQNLELKLNNFYYKLCFYYIYSIENFDILINNFSQKFSSQNNNEKLGFDIIVNKIFNFIMNIKASDKIINPMKYLRKMKSSNINTELKTFIKEDFSRNSSKKSLNDFLNFFINNGCEDNDPISSYQMFIANLLENITNNQIKHNDLLYHEDFLDFFSKIININLFIHNIFSNNELEDYYKNNKKDTYNLIFKNIINSSKNNISSNENSLLEKYYAKIKDRKELNFFSIIIKYLNKDLNNKLETKYSFFKDNICELSNKYYDTLSEKHNKEKQNLFLENINELYNYSSVFNEFISLIPLSNKEKNSISLLKYLSISHYSLLIENYNIFDSNKEKQKYLSLMSISSDFSIDSIRKSIETFTGNEYPEGGAKIINNLFVIFNEKIESNKQLTRNQNSLQIPNQDPFYFSIIFPYDLNLLLALLKIPTKLSEISYDHRNQKGQ